MGYNKNGISESLLKKLSSAKNTAQSSIKTKKYDTSNISASLAQKLGLESADARVSVSNSGGAAVNLNSSENVAKTKKFLKENPTYMYDGKSLVKNPQAEKAIKDLKDYKNALRIMGKNVTNFAGGNTLDDAYNLAKNKKQKEIDTQLKLENDYKHITTYEQAKKEAEKATDETTKSYLLNKADGLKTRSDYESEIADLENQIAEVNKRYAEYEKYPVKDPKLYENTNKHIEDLTKRLTKVKDSYEKNKSDLSKRELTDFLSKNPKVHSTFELLYNIEESKKQNTANADEAVYDKFEVNKLYTDDDSINAQNALKELEKKHGKETIDNYYKWFGRVKEEEKNSYKLEMAKERAKLNPVLTSIESVTTGLVGSIFDNAQQAGAYFGKKFFGGDGYFDPNATNAKYVDTIRGTVSSGIDNDVLKWLYDNGMSLADSGASMALNFVPFIGPALSAGSNYSRAQAHGFNDAYERTGNVQNAFYSGIAQGVAELVFEKVSLDQLIDIKNVGVSSFKDLGLNIAKSAFVEGSEETFTEIANTVTDQIINKDLSNINLSFKNYIAQGYSEEKAWEKVKEDYVMQLGQAFLGGALGGYVFGGGVGAYSYVNNRENTKVLNTSSKEMGQAVIDSGMDAVEEVISNGLKSKNGKVNKLANKLNQINKSGKKVDASDIGNLLKLQETDSVNVEEVVNAGLQEKVDTPAYNLAVTLKEQLNKGETIAINHIRALERELGLKKVSQATDDGAVEYKKGDVKVTISSTLHPNGLYAQTKKGKKVIIAQVESADSKSNSAKILTTDGAVFDIDDLTITDPNFKALLVMTPNLDTNGAKALVANYEKAIEEVGEISGSEYAEHFYNLYEASKDGITFEQAKNVPNLQISINHIGTYTSVLAMSSAQNDINPLTKHWKNSVELVKEVTVNDNAVKLKSGHIYADENVDFKNADISKQLAILDGLAKKANIDVVLSSTLPDYENGRYEDGRIIINANKPSEYIASVVMHEVGHDIKTNNPDAFETLTDFVLDYLKAKNVDIEKRLTEIKRQYKRVFNPDTAREMATEELVCNTLMSIPSEQEAMNVLSEMDIKEKRSLLRALKDFIERIKNYLKKHGLIEARAFTDDFEAINKLANMVNESIVRERSSLETSKHSFEEMDNKYMSAVESGDMETAQRMVDEYAEEVFANSKIRDEDGKLLKVYHGTDADFTVFDKAKGRSSMDIQGMFFSPWDIDARGYGPNVRAFYLNITNPANESTGYRQLKKYKGQYYAGTKAREDLENMGYDGVNNEEEEFIAFNPEQIKSADPVTYDNNGNVIPLSERFKDSNKDIRYSLSDIINDTYQLDGYTQKEIDNWSNSKKIVIYKNNTQLLTFIREALKTPTSSKKMYFGKIPKYIANVIKEKTGLDIVGYNLVLRANEIKKIISNSHGDENFENLRGQRAIIEDDLLLLPQIISNPDDIILSNKLFEGKPVIEFRKMINGKMNVVTYVSKKHYDLTVQTIYSGKKKESLATTPSGFNSLSHTSETLSGTAFNNKILQTNAKVNAESVNSGTNDKNENTTSISKNDIRYSLTEPGEINDVDLIDLFEDSDEAFDYDFTGSNLDFSQDTKEAIQNTNKILADMNRLTKGKKISKEALLKICKKKIKEYSSKQDADILCRDMQIILNALEQSKEQDDFNTVFFEMIGLCKNVLDKSKIKVDHFKKERENVKTILKDYGRIRVDSEQVAEIASAFDGWNNFRYQMSGFANLIKSDNPNSFGRPTLDMVWGELCELCPGLCDPDVNPLEIPMALLNLKEKLKPTYEHLYLNMDEQALEMAQELLAEIYNAKYENEINAKLDKANADFTKKREKQQKKQEEIYKKRYNKQVTKLKEQSALADKLKGREEQIKLQRKTIVVDDGKITRIYEVNAKNAIKVMALHDKKIATEAREEIRKMLTKVARWGVNPNKNAYMPAEFANAFRDLLKVFTVKPKGEAVPKIYEPLNRLRTQYIELGKNRPENYNDLFKENGIENLPTVLSYSKEIREKLDELCEKFKKADIYHISGKELREIASTLKSIINSIENSRTMIVEGKTFEITKFAMGCINELQSTTSKVDNILMEKLHNYELEILSPQRVFRHWGNYDENSNIYKLGEMLNQGQRKAMDYRRDFTIIFNESIANNKKYFKTITGSTAEIIDTGMIINGKKIEITKGMALSLYLNCRNPDNMYHIIHGGVTFPNAKLYKKGKVKESYSRQNATPLTFTDIKKICSIVENDPILMEFAKLVNTLFEKQAVEINKTSVLLFGYEAATIENYFPIISDENFLNKDIDALIFDSTLAGNGSLKHRVRSKNPILLTDVFDVVMKHIDWASDFCGLAIPISNFMKVYNTTIKDDNSVFSFKEELERVWGLKAKSYLENLITKLQTNRNHHNITDRFRGNFAQAVLTMNPRTGLINLSAYPVAASIIGHKPLRQAMKKGFKRAPLELINKYTTIMWYRTQGEKQIHLLSKIRGIFDKNYEPLKNQTELGDVLQKKKLFKKIFDNVQWLTHWIQKADSAVVGRLWYACEYYVNDNYADLEKGTDDYYMQVAEIFIKVVEETQQNYTVMQSPVILNNTDTIFKEAFLMFKSQSLQEFGLIFEATGNLRAKAKAYNENKTATNKEALKQAKQQYARTISGRVVSTVLYVALGFVATFALNKTDRLRDENGEITLMSLGSAFANEFFANLAGLFIGGDELYNFIYALIARENYYPVGLSSVEYLFKIPKDAYNLYISLTDEERDIEKIVKSIKNFVFDGSVVTGLPTKNLWDIVSAIYSHGQNIINGTMLSPDYAKMANSQKAIAMYNALIKGDREKYAKIYNTFIAQGKEDKDIQQYLKTVLSSRNSLVTDGAKAYINNNYDVYENSITELEKIGFATKTIKSAIELKVKELGGDKEEAPTETKTYTVDEIFSNNKEAVYDKDMLWEELIEGNDDNFDMIYSELLESGLTEKQIEQSINSRKRSLIDKYLEAVENSENINAAEYYEQLVNAYGSDSKADKAIEKEEKKDKEKD